MQIPKSLKIKNSIWRIILNGNRLDTSKYRGICYPGSRRIILDPDLSQYDLAVTFIHEILHAAWPANVCDEATEEKIVERLSRSLWRVLHLNKLIKE